MFMRLTTMLCAIQMIANECKCLGFIDLPSDSDNPDKPSIEALQSVSGSTQNDFPRGKEDSATHQPTKLLKQTVNPVNTGMLQRRNVRSGDGATEIPLDDPDYKQKSLEQSESFLKTKISGLINQTTTDVSHRVSNVQPIRAQHKVKLPYQAGFICSLMRKSTTMMNDLFNLAVKHRDNWKSLQQLKVFEYIVHTNVDTTNLVRSLVDIHIRNLNATSKTKKRIIML